jgi:hypothetical protein
VDDPRGYIRDGVDEVDAVAVQSPSGVLLIRPARATPGDVLAGRAGAYAVAAMRARDEWVRAQRTGAAVDVLALGTVLVEAVRDTYDAPTDAVQTWLEACTPETLLAIAAVAIGATPPPRTVRERGRAAALVAAGFGGVPLSAIDTAALADWAVNAGRGPGWA